MDNFRRSAKIRMRVESSFDRLFIADKIKGQARPAPTSDGSARQHDGQPDIAAHGIDGKPGRISHLHLLLFSGSLTAQPSDEMTSRPL
jgi:hypothetical protein